MWPILFRIGSFEVTTFGLMMVLAFAGAGYVAMRQFGRYGLDRDAAYNVMMISAACGIAGAKIYYAILYGDLSLIFSRAGLVYYGGFIGGVIGVWAYLHFRKIDVLVAGDALAPALALGYALGRIGCFLVGDDYGRPTDAWYGIAFPEGAPPTTAASLREFGAAVDPALPPDALLAVHPTQLYEAGSAFLFCALFLWLSRRPHRRGWLLGLCLVLAGLERFLVEFVRAKDDRFLGPFTVAQLISVGLILVGAILLARRDRVVAATSPA